MSKNRKVLLALTPTLLLVTLDTQAQLTKVEGISRQVGSLQRSMMSIKDDIDNQLTGLEDDISNMRLGTAQIQNNQASAHSCASSLMLFNGSHCIPITNTSAPSAAAQTASAAATTSTPSQCSASPELCDIYNDTLGRAPDQAGAHFWQGEMDRLQQNGMSAAQAAAEVRVHIAGSNEALTGSMSTQETQDYYDYAQTHNINTPTTSCTNGLSC